MKKLMAFLGVLTVVISTFIYFRYQAYKEKKDKEQLMQELNRNADVMLYDIKSMGTKDITKDSYGQKDPAVSDELMVWIDEKNGLESFDSIEKEKNGKSDLGVYDMKNGEVILIEEEGAQTLCSVTPEYIVYTSKKDAKGSEIKVKRYYRTRIE
ncbi:hypothetical protein [Clostridium thermarum]|uniref:hypothetical protein n=1 Tax=Clostridium thermarum TaxID=1716543 RepID=UPI00111F4249|nr:hypothetical protein [Clostridium thermarum]